MSQTETDERLQSAVDSISAQFEDGQSIRIVVRGKQKGHKGGRDRTRVLGGPGVTQIILTGAIAQEWINHPTWEPIWNEFGFTFEIDGGDLGKYSLFDVSVKAEIL
jgi:hypothetical protein